jgi:glycosyltransferase involved in cell wall biosynthesis
MGKFIKVMKKPKITFIITALGIGGAEMMLFRLLKVLDQKKYDISLITLKSGGALEKEFMDIGIPSLSAELNSAAGLFRGFSKIKRLLKNIQPDIVFCWMYHANLIGGLAAKHCGIKRIYWNIRNSGLKEIWKMPITSAIIEIGALLSGNIPDLIILNSNQARDNHIRIGYDEFKMRVLHNGINTDDFQPDTKARRFIRKELNVRSTVLLVGMTARFHPQKDHKTFLEAANLIVSKVPNVQFVLCGTNIDESNEKLAAWISEFSLEEKVLLLGERRDMPKVMGALDLLMLSSAYGESFPNVIAEAMSCEIPCVATDVGDSAFIIGDSGLIVPAENPHALGEAAVILLTNNAERIKLGKKARIRIQNEFSIETISKEYEKLFEY